MVSSYDVAAWYCPANLSETQAADYFARLNGRLVVVEHRPEVDSFLRELSARFPDRSADAEAVSVDEVSRALLETWDDLTSEKLPPPPTPAQIAKRIRNWAVFEDSPWGESLSANGDTVLLPFRWSRAEAAIPVVMAMARQHGLTTFDSQTGRVSNPVRPPKQNATEFLSVHLTMRLAGQPPAVEMTLVRDGETVVQKTMPDRASAHAEARRVAVERHDRAYEVVDPRSLAQGLQVVPLAPNKNPVPPAVIDALRKQGITIEMGTVQGPDDSDTMYH